MDRDVALLLESRRHAEEMKAHIAKAEEMGRRLAEAEASPHGGGRGRPKGRSWQNDPSTAVSPGPSVRKQASGADPGPVPDHLLPF